MQNSKNTITGKDFIIKSSVLSAGVCLACAFPTLLIGCSNKKHSGTLENNYTSQKQKLLEKITYLEKYTKVLFLVILMVINGNLTAQNPTDNLVTELQKTLDRIQQEVNFPGITCAVILPDDCIIKLASGYSDSDKNINMKNTHRMFSGSTGKTFVAAVLLQLVEEDKLSLNDKVSKYLGEYGWYKKIPNSADLTINMLAHHTGGLPRYILNEKFNTDVLADVNKIWTPEERLSYIFDMEPIHPAGNGWYYSDTDYILLGMIIEKVCGNTLYSEVQNRFIKPLNLNTIEPAISRNPSGLAQGHSGENPYINAPVKVVKNGKYFINPQFEWCGGGFIGSSPDLAKWAKLFFSGSIFNDESKVKLYSTVDFETGKESEYGYGIATIISETTLSKKIGHTGLMMGYLTELAYYPKYDFAIAIQINQDDFQGEKKNLGEYSLKFAEIVSKQLNNIKSR